MQQNPLNGEFNFIRQLKYIQNINAKTMINLLDQSFFIKYDDIDIINKINSNIKNINKISLYTPKMLKQSTINDQTIFFDFIPSGSLADFIYFKEKDINTPLIKNFEQLKLIISYLIINISEIFIKYKLIHTNLTPEHLLFSNNLKPMFGGVEYIQQMTSSSNIIKDKSPFSIYIAPEVKKGNPVAESYSYTLSLLIFSVLTLTCITQIPEKCPQDMEPSLFSFLISCCDDDPSKRPKIADIKREIIKYNNDLVNLNFQEIYSNSRSYGTKDNLVDLIEIQWPIAFYIVGNTFVNGNIYDMTSKEAISFLNISKLNFLEETKKADNLIKNYYKEREELYIADIDEQIQKIKEMPKETYNISFYNQDPSLVEDQINISIFNTLNLNNELPEYGFFGPQAITDSLELNKQNTCLPENLLVKEVSSLSIDNQTPLLYQSIANAKLSCRDKCNTAATRFQKRNINLHGLTQIGALQIATRMFSDLNPDINYEIVLNTGKGIHSVRSESLNLGGGKMNQPRGNESVLGFTLSNAIQRFTGEMPSVGVNQGTLTMKIKNIEKDRNNDDCYF